MCKHFSPCKANIPTPFQISFHFSWQNVPCGGNQRAFIVILIAVGSAERIGKLNRNFFLLFLDRINVDRFTFICGLTVESLSKDLHIDGSPTWLNAFKSIKVIRYRSNNPAPVSEDSCRSFIIHFISHFIFFLFYHFFLLLPPLFSFPSLFLIFLFSIFSPFFLLLPLFFIFSLLFVFVYPSPSLSHFFFHFSPSFFCFLRLLFNFFLLFFLTS